MTALVVGTLLALGALSFVLYPLFMVGPLTEPRPTGGRSPNRVEASRNPALDALREIEFDRETGKLSDADYQALRSTYTQAAVESMRAGELPICPTCGPRPDKDAIFCSNCGASLAS